MSRGGRYRAGRAARGPRPPKLDLPWDERGGRPDTEPTPLFPPLQLSSPKPLSDIEKRQVDHYRSLRAKIHDGPYYTVLASNPSESTQAPPSARSQFDPFEQGMPTYSQRFKRKKRTLPRLNKRPYVLKFFPKELWSTIDPKGAMQNKLSTLRNVNSIDANQGESSEGKGAKRKFSEDDDEDVVTSPTRTTKRKHTTDDVHEDDDELLPRELRDFADADEIDDAPTRKKKKIRIGSDDEENEIEISEDDAEQPAEGEEEDVDDDFEDDEDDMADDYNAEGYFDAGDDKGGEDGDVDGGGGAGGDDYY